MSDKDISVLHKTGLGICCTTSRTIPRWRLQEILSTTNQLLSLSLNEASTFSNIYAAILVEQPSSLLRMFTIYAAILVEQPNSLFQITAARER